MRKRNSVVTVLSHGPLMALLLWSCSDVGQNLPGPLAQFCGTDTSPGSGNLDRPASVAIAVIKDEAGAPVGAFALNVNPDLRQARAVDVRQGTLVRSPAVYFPMAVKMGTFTEDVVVSEDGRVAFALDAADRHLIAFRVGDAPPANNPNENENWKRYKGEGGNDGEDGILDVDARPTGVAVRGRDDDTGLLIAVSHAGDPVGSVTLITWVKGNVRERRRINVGGRPSGVGITEDRAWVVASNALDGNAFLVPAAADPLVEPPLTACDATVRTCTFSVGLPSNDVTVGTQPSVPGGLRYPVALFTHVDVPRVSVVRLRTEGNADTPARVVEALEAQVAFPSTPVASALAPLGAPICCRGGPYTNNPELLAGGGFAYAVVALVDGSVTYLDLNAKSADGRRTPRLMDTNTLLPGFVVDLNTEPSIYQEPGLEAGASAIPSLRPQVRTELLADIADLGQTVVNQQVDADYTLTWEGVLATLGERRGQVTRMQLQQGILQDALPGLDFAAQGVLPGDILELPVQEGCACPVADPDAGTCDVVAALPIVELAGPTLRVAGTFEARDCLLPPGATENFFNYRIRVSQAFEVRRSDDATALGRVRYFEPLTVPGARIQLLPAGYLGGLPDVPGQRGGIVEGPVTPVALNAPPQGTTLRIPVRSNFSPFRIDLDDVDYSLGRFLPGNAVPTGIATAMAPTRAGAAGEQARVDIKAIGFMSAAGGGLLLQFDLGVHPNSVDGRVVRNSLDPTYKVFE